MEPAHLQRSVTIFTNWTTDQDVALYPHPISENIGVCSRVQNYFSTNTLFNYVLLILISERGLKHKYPNNISEGVFMFSLMLNFAVASNEYNIFIHIMYLHRLSLLSSVEFSLQCLIRSGTLIHSIDNSKLLKRKLKE